MKKVPTKKNTSKTERESKVKTKEQEIKTKKTMAKSKLITIKDMKDHLNIIDGKIYLSSYLLDILINTVNKVIWMFPFIKISANKWQIDWYILK